MTILQLGGAGMCAYTYYCVYQYHKNKYAEQMSQRSENGSTPLIDAVLADDIATVSELLSYQIDANIEDKFKKTALYYATYSNNYNLVDMLLARSNCNPNKMQKVPSSTEADSNTYGYTKRLSPRLQQRFRQAWPALIIACREGYAKTAKRLLRDKRVNPNIQDEEGRTPIYHGCREGKQEIVKVLLDDPRVLWNEACPVKVKELFKDVEITNITPLQAATQHGHTSIVDILTKRQEYSKLTM